MTSATGKSFTVLVEVRLRPGIADPQGATIERALPALGFDGISGVRAGKSFRFDVRAPDHAAAVSQATVVAERLLANPVIEESSVTVSGPVLAEPFNSGPAQLGDAPSAPKAPGGP